MDIDTRMDPWLLNVHSLPDPALESTQICQALANVTTDTRIQSLCLGDGQSMVECPLGRVYPCPPDLWCQRRGLRAYCVPPGSLNSMGILGYWDIDFI